jgi:hypothetical protein
MITFKVPSSLYGQTDCVITDISHTLKTGYAPCGDGCDYKLTAGELEQLKCIQAGEPMEFIHDEKLKKVNHLNLQQINDLKFGGAVVIGGKYIPGKLYLLNGIKAKCTSWFDGPKSSFVKI